MADEIRLRSTLSFAKSGRFASADSGELSITMTGTKSLDTIQTIGTAEEALQLGEVSAANTHYYIENLDTANPIDLKPATGAVVTTRIAAGRCAVGQFGPLVTAPFVQAITSPVDIRLLLIQS